MESALFMNHLFVSLQSYDWTYIEDEEEEKNIFFSPDRGNVIFASALDGWGFT